MADGGPSGTVPLPHGAPARLVTRVVARAAGTVTCAARVPSASAFTASGHAPAFLALEMGAQAAAVLHAPGGETGTAPAAGYLVGVREARFAVATIGVDEEHLVEVRATGEAPPLRTYAVRVTDAAGREVARATVSTWISGEGRHG